MLVDIHLADGILAVKGYNINRDSTNIELVYQDVINKYNTTQKQFLETVTYYSKEPREYERIYEKVSEKLAKLESELEEESKKKREENAKKNKDKIQK